LGKSAVVFQFGDTFSHDDAGEFVRGTSSTAAIVQDPVHQPTVTSYTLDEEGEVPSFIPMRPEEKTQYGKRATLWCFGGIIEIGEADGDVAAGWVFYQKGTHVSDRRLIPAQKGPESHQEKLKTEMKIPSAIPYHYISAGAFANDTERFC
jgi:hypothetical protein